MADTIKMTDRPTINIPEAVIVDVETDISAYNWNSLSNSMYISSNTEVDIEMGYTEDDLEDAVDYWEHVHDYDY